MLVTQDVSASKEAVQLPFLPTANIPATDVQRAIEYVRGLITGPIGDTSGPSSATDNAIARFDGATGKLLQNSIITIGDTGVVAPTANDGGALGTTALGWADLFGATGFTFNIANGNWLATHTSGILTVGTGDLRVTTVGTNTASVVTVGGTQTLTAKTLTSPAINTGTIGTSLVPTANDGAALGSTTNQFSDLFLASGGVINWANGLVTITQSAGALLLASNAGAVTFQIVGTGNAGIEIGRIDGSTSTPFIDFHSGATAVDNDVRLIASGGTGVAGGGLLTINAAAGIVGTGTISTSGSAVGFVGFSATSTEAAAAAGPILLLDRNSASPADQDTLGEIIFRGRDSGANATDYVTINARATTVANGTEASLLFFETMQAGALQPTVILEGGAAPAWRPSGSTTTLTLGNTSVPFATTYTTSIELGAAGVVDTTITRSAAGVIAVEGIPLFSNIPQNSQSAAYTLVLADAQKHILHPTADNNARTFTIPANSSVAYPIGTALTFVNQINTVTIAITTDTMTLAGAGTTGSRTLAASGIATAIKLTSTSWIISGTGLT